MRIRMLFAATAVGLCGCTSLPNFQGTQAGITPRAIAEAIECELRGINTKKYFATHLVEVVDDKGKKSKKETQWVAVAELTLQVDEQMTIAPSFTHSSTTLSAATRLFDWSIKFDSTAQRTYVETLEFKIENSAQRESKAPPPRQHSCDVSQEHRRGLTGGLGLEEIARMAIDADSTGKGPKAPSIDGVGKAKVVFGSSIQFVVTANINAAGPTWTLVHFKGPGKLFLAERKDTHKIIISFVEVQPVTRSKATRVVIAGDERGVLKAEKLAEEEKRDKVTQRLLDLNARVFPQNVDPAKRSEHQNLINEEEKKKKKIDSRIEQLKTEIARTPAAGTATFTSGTARVLGDEAREEALARARLNNQSIKLQGLGSTIGNEVAQRLR